MEKYVLPLLKGKLLAIESNIKLYEKKLMECVGDQDKPETAKYMDEQLHQAREMRNELTRAINVISDLP